MSFCFPTTFLGFVFNAEAEAEAEAGDTPMDTPMDGSVDILGLGTLGLLRLLAPCSERAFRVLSSRNMRLE